MIEIKEFNNVYGIKRLINSDLIKGNTIIYAPNGVMKTSFSDGIRDISNGQLPKDVFSNPNIYATFKIVENENCISNESPNFRINAMVYELNTLGNEAFENPKIGSLVMSNDLKQKYIENLNNYEKAKNSFAHLISINIMGRKKTNENDMDDILKLIGASGFEDCLAKLPDLSQCAESEYKDINYSVYFNQKALTAITSKDFSEKCNLYLKHAKDIFDEKVFNNGFTFDALKKVKIELDKNKFFDAGHKIVLQEKGEMGKIELEKYLRDVTNEVYGSEDLKTEFDQAKSVLAKNSDSKKLVEGLNANPSIMTKLENVNEFQKEVLFSKMKNYSNEIENMKTTIKDCLEINKQILMEANSDAKLWRKVLNDYNSRFVTNKFDAVIVNIEDEDNHELQKPIFKRIIRGTNNEITAEVFKRFSSGEKRAISILNLMYEVELRKKEKFTLVLDDISDSFDYKNKYAIINCLRDFAENKNIQLILLTHNFDFYRSIRIALKNSLDSKLLAYSKNGEVKLYNAKQEYFEDHYFYSDIVNNGNLIDLLASIPFLRNIVQLEKNVGQNNDEYLQLTALLHYNRKLEERKIDDFSNILSKHGIKYESQSIKDRLYLDCLKEEAENIIKSDNIKETNLREKIILGMFIRVFSERYMWNKYCEFEFKEPIIEDEKNQAHYLYNAIKKKINDNEKNILITSFTIAPSFIHVNSFMFEPLIDVGGENLVKNAKDVLNLNNFQ